jgi:uncharacterized membrane protein YdjX (TVP38/TMEM64 family)
MTIQDNMQDKPSNTKTKNLLLTAARIVSILFVIALTIYIYSIRDQAEQLAVYGYPGIFLLAFLTNATVLLPAPGIAVVFAMGAIFNPVYIALAAGAGGALGELSGYLAGFSGQAIIERMDIYERYRKWIEKRGFVAILLLAVIPNPFFDAAGIAAGMLKMPLYRFLLAVWIGVTIKMFLFAWVGSTSLSWILK